MVDTAAGGPRTGGRGERLAEPGYALAMARLARRWSRSVLS